MESVLDLPSEVLLQIFQYLTPTEVNDIIYRLSPLQQIEKSRLLKLLYERLFNGKLMIVNDINTVSKYDTLLTTQAFKNMFSSTTYVNSIFKVVRPNYIEFNFSRQASDYSRFINNLYKFNRILEDEDKENQQMLDYFERVQQLDFVSDGNLMLIENPATLSTILIKILINLANNDRLTSKFKNITIKSFDIGHFYVSLWGQLFQNFNSLTLLNLSDNLIESDYETASDVLGSYFKFPPVLKTLVLDNNSILRITQQFLQNLPKTLENLLMNRNKINFLEVNDLRWTLPCLKMLQLNYNHQLTFLEPNIFKSVGEEFAVMIRGCNIDEIQLAQLRTLSSRRHFAIIS